jgi:hypothetical protein
MMINRDSLRKQHFMKLLTCINRTTLFRRLLGCSVLVLASWLLAGPGTQNLHVSSSLDRDFHGLALKSAWMHKHGMVQEAMTIFRANNASSLPKGRRVVVQTVGINTVHPNLDNHMSYSAKWGLDYALMDQRMIGYGRHTPAWLKIPATLALLELGYDFVMWLDQDALFANCNQSLDFFLDQMDQAGTSWLFSGDTLIINSGIVLFKNTQTTRDILLKIDILWYPGIDADIKVQENGAIAAYLAGARKPIRQDLQKAYEKADECYERQNQQLCEDIKNGNKSALEHIGVDPTLLQHISYVPKLAINAYLSDLVSPILSRNTQTPAHHLGQKREPYDSIFIFHCAGQGDKEACKQQFLGITHRNQGSLVCHKT